MCPSLVVLFCSLHLHILYNKVYIYTRTLPIQRQVFGELVTPVLSSYLSNVHKIPKIEIFIYPDDMNFGKNLVLQKLTSVHALYHVCYILWSGVFWALYLAPLIKMVSLSGLRKPPTSNHFLLSSLAELVYSDRWKVCVEGGEENIGSMHAVDWEGE